MKNIKRKGFTLVELVIVIAVIAILAAVLIPTFTNIIKKANLSVDETTNKNMNTALVTAQIGDGKIDNASEAREALYAAGFTKESLVPKTANHKYYWNITYNVVLLVDCSSLDESEWEVLYPTKGYDEAIEEFNDLDTRWEKNFNLADLPLAEVSPINVTLEKKHILESDGGSLAGFPCINLPVGSTLPLDVALNFKAKETADEARDASYGNWYVDFIVTVNKDLSEYTDQGTKFYLAGMYESFSTGWIVVDITDFDVQADQKYPLLGTMLMPFTYIDICEYVQEFQCGISAVGDVDLTGLEITLQLVMFETMENYENLIVDTIIYEYKYKF